MTIRSGAWELPGMLDMPNNAEQVPAVILVHGSGPNDRDETIGANKPFRDLAWGLATRGIAVLRYDKRTLVYASEPAKFGKVYTVKEEVIDDAVAAARLVAAHRAIDGKRVYLLGHSLGGTLAPRIARAYPQLAGLILLAGATRPLADLATQMTYLSNLHAATTADEQQQLDQLNSQIALLNSPELMTLPPESPLLGAPAAYSQDLHEYQPEQLAKRLPQPMLILQGGRDYQVTETDFRMWQAALAARTDVKFKLFPHLNHLFITGTAKSTPAEYEVTGHVDKAVIDEIAGWISGKL